MIEEIGGAILILVYGVVCYLSGKGDLLTLIPKMLQNRLEEIEKEIGERKMDDVIEKLGSILQSRNATPEEVKKAYGSVFKNANKCVQCGGVIPEGRQVCLECEKKDGQRK